MMRPTSATLTRRRLLSLPLTARVGKIAHGRYEDALTWDISENSGVEEDSIKDPATPKNKASKRQQAAPGETMGGGIKLSWLATNHKDEYESGVWREGLQSQAGAQQYPACGLARGAASR